MLEGRFEGSPFDILAGEPAMTVIPNLLVTGALAEIVALAVGIWSVRLIECRDGGPVLIALSLLLLLVGGGVARRSWASSSASPQ